MRKLPALAAIVACLWAVIVGSAAPALAGLRFQPHAASQPIDAFNRVSCSTAKDCVAVGISGNGDPVLQTWNGSKWTSVALKVPAKSIGGDMLGVSCMSAKKCLAVGNAFYSETVGGLAESGSGKTWSLHKPQAGVTGLGAVSCTAAQCVAIASTSKNPLLADSWNGSKWTTEVKLPKVKGSSYATLSAISCVLQKGCVAVGGANPGATSGFPAADVWNGKSWSAVRLPQPKGTGEGSLDAVSCLSLTKCFAVGTSQTKTSSVAFADELSGTRWKSVTLVTSKTITRLVGVSCGSPKSCLAVGEVGGGVYVDSGKAYSESWNGAVWKPVKVPTPPHGAGSSHGSELDGVSCLPPTDCVAVGEAGPAGSTGYGFSGSWNGKSWKLTEAA